MGLADNRASESAPRGPIMRFLNITNLISRGAEPDAAWHSSEGRAGFQIGSSYFRRLAGPESGPLAQTAQTKGPLATPVGAG